MAEDARCEFRKDKLQGVGDLAVATRTWYEGLVAASPVAEQEPLQSIVTNYRKRYTGATLAQLASDLDEVGTTLKANVPISTPLAGLQQEPGRLPDLGSR
jgi:hypothetical protein